MNGCDGITSEKLEAAYEVILGDKNYFDIEGFKLFCKHAAVYQNNITVEKTSFATPQPLLKFQRN